MIPTQNFDAFPEFSNTGSKIKPDDAKYAAGFVPSDVLPAQWLNWLLNKSSAGITALNTGVKSVEEELNNVVSEAGITPASGTKNQVLDAIKAIIGNFTGTLANLTTTAKTNLVAAINELKSNVTANTTAIGENSEAIAQNTAAIQSINNFMLPVGTILPFGGENAPTDFLLCDGREVSRSTYSTLFAVIGVKFGIGDGTTTFNLPDYRDRTMQGASVAHSVGEKLEAGLPNITGEFKSGSRRAFIESATGAMEVSDYGSSRYGDASSTAYGGVKFDASKSNSIYGNSDTVQPPAQTCNFIIKY